MIDVMTKDNVLIVYGASDDLVEFEGVLTDEFECYNGWFGKVVDSSGEFVLLHVTYGDDGVEWKLRLENPFGWEVAVGERPDRDDDPAFFITTPSGKVVVEELDGLWENPRFHVVAE